MTIRETKEPEAVVDAFNKDVSAVGGYQYTTGLRLSSRMANQRLSDVAMKMVDWKSKSVIDIGCGDGEYTVELYDRGHPESIVAIDPAALAIEHAKSKVGHRNIDFKVGSAYETQYPDSSFDVAHIRGVLHHLDHPELAIREGLRVAREILVIEPNGYNPGLKLLEKYSKYHIEHGEKSYPAKALRKWVKEAGGTVVRETWAGLVPFFCSDLMARTLKTLEPVVEFTPGLKLIGSAVFVFTARRADQS